MLAIKLMCSISIFNWVLSPIVLIKAGMARTGFGAEQIEFFELTEGPSDMPLGHAGILGEGFDTGPCLTGLPGVFDDADQYHFLIDAEIAIKDGIFNDCVGSGSMIVNIGHGFSLSSNSPKKWKRNE